MLVAATARRPSMPASLDALSLRLSPTQLPAPAPLLRTSPQRAHPPPIMGNSDPASDPPDQGWPSPRVARVADIWKETLHSSDVPSGSGGRVQSRRERQLTRGSR